MPKKKPLPASVRDKILAEVDLPQVMELAGYFAEAMGGPKALAYKMAREFDLAGEGSVTRQRILQMMLGTFAAASAMMPQAPEAGGMTDDELERECRALLTRMTGAETEETPDGGADPEPAAAQ